MAEYVEWNKRHARMNRNCEYKRKYGITVDDYDKLLEAQGGVCAICKKPDNDKRDHRLVVDHDHVTKKVRGLLCHPCNRALGLFEKNRQVFEVYILKSRNGG